MSGSRRSWEIIVAGLAFSAIAIYFLSDTSSRERASTSATAAAPSAPERPSLPSTIVIDLEQLKNLDNLKNLRNLENLENLKNLEELESFDIQVEQLEELIDDSSVEAASRSLEAFRQRLQESGQADYRVQLQNRKLFIDRDYEVEQGNWTEVDPGVFVYTRSLDTDGLEKLELSLGFGNLNVVGSEEGSGKLTVQATGDVASAGYISENLIVRRTDEQGTGRIEISGSDGTEISNRVNLEATLTLPRGITVNATTAGGHITANNFDGTQQFETSGGHINLTSISGNTTAHSRGGHIVGNRLSGTFRLQTEGGHIRVSRLDGELEARTGGGHIQLESLTGSVDAETSGGNIDAQVDSAGGPLSLVTSAGNITLLLPSGLGAELQARGTQVHLAEGFGFEGSKTAGNITGSLNGGGIPITLRCGYGNVTIRHE